MIKHNAGVTLVETIIYIALFALLIGGVTVAAYSMFQSNDDNRTQAMIVEEGNFLLAKISWALSSAASVAVPPSGQNGQALSITSADSAVENPIVITASGNNISISRGNYPAEILNNSNTLVETLLFNHTSSGDLGTLPESIETHFRLTARTPEGKMISEDFSATRYIRK